MQVKIPYDTTFLQAEIPDEILNGVYSSGLPEPEKDGTAIVKDALDHPIGSPRLEEIAKGKKNALVIASDHTRPVPSQIILPQMLERLRSGQPDIQITILIATGLHRGSTPGELRKKLGDEIMNHEKIVLHDSFDDSQLADFGLLPSGAKLKLNRLVAESDLVVSEGFIEPHFFAGFSGGRKSILPGVASADTVKANHCAEMIRSPFARTGILENNPIHQEMLYAAQRAKLAFIVNTVLNGKHEIVHAVAGSCEAAHAAGCKWLKDICRVRVPMSDIVLTSNGGYPLDQNVYQSVKGMTAAENVCRKGGVIIMTAACKDGHGGESFYRSLSESKDLAGLLKHIESVPRNKTISEQWELQIALRVMTGHTVLFVTNDCPHTMLEEMGFRAFSTIDAALAEARRLIGEKARISVIPDGVSVITEPE